MFHSTSHKILYFKTLKTLLVIKTGVLWNSAFGTSSYIHASLWVGKACRLHRVESFKNIIGPQYPALHSNVKLGLKWLTLNNALGREVLQRGKAQYSWPPSINQFSTAHFYIENIISLFTKQATSMRRLTVLSIPPQLVFLALSYNPAALIYTAKSFIALTLERKLSKISKKTVLQIKF